MVLTFHQRGFEPNSKYENISNHAWRIGELGMEPGGSGFKPCQNNLFCPFDPAN